MKYVTIWTVAVVLCFTTILPARALDDTPANRAAQADNYLQAVPPRSLMKDMADKLAATLPENQRATFIALLTKNLDMNAVTNLMRSAMIKNFSADELKALADFYSSPAGKSAMAKMGNYMADAMGPLQAELAKSLAITQQEMKAK